MRFIQPPATTVSDPFSLMGHRTRDTEDRQEFLDSILISWRVLDPGGVSARLNAEDNINCPG